PRIGRGRGPTGGPARGTRRGERARVRDGRRPDAVLRRHAASQRARATCRSPIASAETTRRRTMEYRRFGNTGMYVSPIALGCMSYGDPERGSHGWTLDEETSRPFIREAVESGINFFDTANMYSLGHSEEIVGRALRDYADRDEIVLATKVYMPMGDGPNKRGLSRKAIMQEIDNSLRRLGTDYVDL